MDIHKILNLLSSAKLPVDTEKETKRAIEDIFIANKIYYEREFFLDKNNVPDFYIEGIVIQVKIKGSIINMFKQCQRYCNFEQVGKLILITNRDPLFPQEINYRPCYVINLQDF